MTKKLSAIARLMMTWQKWNEGRCDIVVRRRIMEDAWGLFTVIGPREGLVCISPNQKEWNDVRV